MNFVTDHKITSQFFIISNCVRQGGILLPRIFAIHVQCIRKVTSHEGQSGSRKFTLQEPLFCLKIWGIL